MAESLRLQRSFESTDLAVIDWDAALVVDLSGYTEDVLYVLELANLQVRRVPHDGPEARPPSEPSLRRPGAPPRHRPCSASPTPCWRTLRRYRVDVTQLADQVTHITKFIGDWYLARVYLTARERFHLDQWRASVEQRLAQLDRLYSVLHGEVNEKRMLWMEAAIVVLFIIDLAAIFWWK